MAPLPQSRCESWLQRQGLLKDADHRRPRDATTDDTNGDAYLILSFAFAASVVCLSGDFEIPVVAEYEAKFHIAQRLTIIKLDKNEKQFPNDKPGRINIGLKPDATGKCADTWDADVRVFLVADDGRRSGTKWFHLSGGRP